MKKQKKPSNTQESKKYVSTRLRTASWKQHKINSLLSNSKDAMSHFDKLVEEDSGRLQKGALRGTGK